SNVIAGIVNAGCTNGGITVGGGAVEILDNQLLDCQGNAIYLSHADESLIRGNRIERNAGGIDMSSDTNIRIVGNLIVNNRGNGLTCAVGASEHGPWIINNTLAQNQGAQIAIDGYDGYAEIENNIIIGVAGQTAISGGNFTHQRPVC